MNDAIASFVGVVTLIIVLAIITVFVTGKSSANLVQSASVAFDTLLGRATKQGA